jgi:hypothetical protein
VEQIAMDSIATSDLPPRAPSQPAVLGLTALLGLLSGIAIMAFAALVERSDLTVFGLSLRGNGALVVPLVGAPAALATGWSALALGLRAGRRRAAGRAGLPTPLVVPLVGLATLPLGLVLAHAPLFGRPLVIAAALLAPAVGWALAALSARLGRRGLLAGAALALVLLAVPESFFLAVPLAVVLPLVADLPPTSAGGRVWSAGGLAAACALLLVALLVGLIVGAVGLATFGE